MGRPALPPAERRLRGNAGKRKPRTVSMDSAAAPAPAGADPPAWLQDPEALGAWRQAVPHLAKRGLLSGAYLTALAVYCQAVAAWVKAQGVIAEKGATYVTTSKHGELERVRPEVRIAEQAEKTMLRYGAQFGLAPMASAKVASAFAANGVQLPLPGFEAAPPPQPNRPSAADAAPSDASQQDPAASYFGYH